MLRALRPFLPALLALILWPQPAAADQAFYERLVRCAAYDTMAVAVLDNVKQDKDKKAIKRHKQSAQQAMELASGLLDPYHVPPARVAADAEAFYREQLARMQQGTDFSVIMGEAQSTCVDFAFP